MSIIYSRQQDGTINVLCAGFVSQEPEVKDTAKGTRVKFSVCYGKKQYLTCEAWGDTDVGAIASCLEKHDTVAVMGAYRTWDYNGKTYSSVSADMLFTLAAPTAFPAPDDAPAQTATATAEAEPQSGYVPRQMSEYEDSDCELPF